MKSLSDSPGAYVIVVHLDAPLALTIASLEPTVLPPGLYAYCGNAYGAGGIGARVARHLRPNKPKRWHVDHLTAAGRITAIGVLPGGRECDLLARVLDAPGARVPVAALGSSDCRRCPAHLAAVPADFDLRAIVPVRVPGQAWSVAVSELRSQ